MIVMILQLFSKIRIVYTNGFNDIVWFRYALTCIPSADEWTPALKSNFIKGYKCLLELLECVQVSLWCRVWCGFGVFPV